MTEMVLCKCESCMFGAKWNPGRRRALVFAIVLAVRVAPARLWRRQTAVGAQSALATGRATGRICGTISLPPTLMSMAIAMCMAPILAFASFCGQGLAEGAHDPEWMRVLEREALVVVARLRHYSVVPG